MKRPLAALLLFGLLGFGAYHALLAPPSVAAATQSLNSVQADLKTAATTTNAAASEIGQALADPNRGKALPAELQAFTRSADHLNALRSTLIEDLAAYQTAANAKLANFDQERNKVSDEHTTRSLLAVSRSARAARSAFLSVSHAGATVVRASRRAVRICGLLIREKKFSAVGTYQSFMSSPRADASRLACTSRVQSGRSLFLLHRVDEAGGSRRPAGRAACRGPARGTSAMPHRLRRGPEPARAVITFDQSNYRLSGLKLDEQRQVKMRYLAKSGLFSFYYVSHAPFLFTCPSADRDTNCGSAY